MMKNENSPYQSRLLDQVLHTKLQGIKDMHYSDSDAALKNVALVGMLLPDTQNVRNGHWAGAYTWKNFNPMDAYRIL